MPATVARLPSRPSRPTIRIDGESQPRLEAAMLSYRLHASIESMASAEIEFGNWGGEDAGFQFFSRDILDFGKEIVVSLQNEILFQGRISAINGRFPSAGPPTIVVLAEDRLQDLRMTRRSRSFEQVSLADVADAIARDHGLTAQVEVETAVAPVLTQVNQTDFAFLFDLARRFNAKVHISEQTLYVTEDRGTPPVDLRWSGTLREFDVTADLARQYNAIIASGWDVASKEAISHEADSSEMSAEIGSDTGGAALLEEFFEPRIETLAHLKPSTVTEAREFANGAYRRMARDFVMGEGECETDPLIHVGAMLELSGLGDLFNGLYRALEVTHCFDPQLGALSEFRCHRAGIGRPS